MSTPDFVMAAESAYQSKWEASNAAFDAAFIQRVRQIEEVFFSAIEHDNPYELELPYVSNDVNRRACIKYQTVEQYLKDDALYNKPVMDALLAVLKHSDCQHVAALREAMCNDYLKSWASDLASFDTEE